MEGGTITMQNSLTYSKITKVYLSCDLAIPFLHVHPRKTKIYVHTKTCTIMYTPGERRKSWIETGRGNTKFYKEA